MGKKLQGQLPRFQLRVAVDNFLPYSSNCVCAVTLWTRVFDFWGLKTNLQFNEYLRLVL